MTPRPRVTGVADPRHAGRCTFRPFERWLPCMKPARWHGVQEQRRYGIMTCDEHRDLMTDLVHWVHEAEVACGLPTAYFDAERNTCLVNWDTVERQLGQLGEE